MTLTWSTHLVTLTWSTRLVLTLTWSTHLVTPTVSNWQLFCFQPPTKQPLLPLCDPVRYWYAAKNTLITIIFKFLLEANDADASLLNIFCPSPHLCVFLLVLKFRIQSHHLGGRIPESATPQLSPTSTPFATTPCWNLRFDTLYQNCITTLSNENKIFLINTVIPSANLCSDSWCVEIISYKCTHETSNGCSLYFRFLLQNFVLGKYFYNPDDMQIKCMCF